MLLTGTYPRTLDDKQRVPLPKPLRAALSEAAEALCIAPCTDGSLALYGQDAFRKLADRLAEAPSAGTDIRAFSRLFYANAGRVELDGQGRIRIPLELA